MKKQMTMCLMYVLLLVLTGCGGTIQSRQQTSECITQEQSISETGLTKDQPASETEGTQDQQESDEEAEQEVQTDFSYGTYSYTGEPYEEINGNIPYFSDADKERTDAFETYSELDSLGRCGVAYANICKELMPTEERGEIGMIKPSGWHTVKYPGVIEGNYLYNRCHLIAFELAGENANEKNLITGTRYLNIMGMLPFENQIAEYVKCSGNHVLYRVTPVYQDEELVARGVLMEAYSVEDEGEGVCFCVYVYNVQPGIQISYKDGESSLEEAAMTQSQEEQIHVILNTNTKKFHLPSCSSVKAMKEQNKQEYNGNRDELLKQGYEPCKRCDP